MGIHALPDIYALAQGHTQGKTIIHVLMYATRGKVYIRMLHTRQSKTAHGTNKN